MKVIGVSNFDNESQSDILIARGLTCFGAEALAKEKNKNESGHYAMVYYRAVGDSYELYTFEP